MKLLDKLERKGNKFAIPHLMLLIVAVMFTVYCINLMFPQVGLIRWLELDRSLVLQGQVWRLISFIFIPPNSSPIWLVIGLYFYYMIGTELERQWGAFRFNVYYFVGILGAIVAGMIAGAGTISYLNLSLFFAFALLYPNFEVRLFFVLPLKIKYLAFINALLFVVSLFTQPWPMKVAILFSILNFLLFFSGDFINRIKMQRQFSKNQKVFRDFYDKQNRY